jgi:phosphoribosylglycinamide formyltransferase-1
MTRRLVAVASGRGSILGVALDHDELVRAQVVSVVTDRECGALGLAEKFGIPSLRIDEGDKVRLSDAILAHCRAVGADTVVLFFNRLLAGDLLAEYERRIVNIHASLLPGFKGLRALDQARAAGARFAGATVHFIDEHVDEGQIILQSVLPLDPDEDEIVLRHRQFEQMCKGLIQTCHWIEEDRIGFAGGRVTIRDARYDQPDFSPALEAASALQLSLPIPVRA